MKNLGRAPLILSVVRACKRRLAAHVPSLSLLSLLFATCAPANANVVNATEVMMEAQGLLAITIAARFGPDASSPLSFISNVDPEAETFSFRLLPGETYLGAIASLSTEGSFNPERALWEWSIRGSIGDVSISAYGYSPPLDGDPPIWEAATVSDRPVLFIEVFEDVTYTQTAIRTVSEGTIVVSVNSVVTHRGKHTDSLILQGEKKGMWRWDTGSVTGTNPKNSFDIGTLGMSPIPSGGMGTFEVRISPVPEPGTLLLCATGIGAGCFVRRRWQEQRPVQALVDADDNKRVSL